MPLTQMNNIKTINPAYYYQQKIYKMTNIETLETLTGQNQKPEGKLFYREQIPNTPFWIIENAEGYNIIFANYRLNKTPITPDTTMRSSISIEQKDKILYTAQLWLAQNQYNVMLDMIIIISEIKQQQKTN